VVSLCCTGNYGKAGKLTVMKMAKAIRQQAATAERVAVNTADTYVADQMRALAQAFRTQAEIIKKNKKKKKK
jgi:G3E family GTPase